MDTIIFLIFMVLPCYLVFKGSMKLLTSISNRSKKTIKL